MNYRIPLSYNAIDQEALGRVLQGYEGRHHHALIADFEAGLKALTGAPYVVALNSGTAAIHLGLMALGVTAGDEVLVSDFTYVASINPVLYLGARPVFVDSERSTWNMDPVLLEEAIAARMKEGVKPAAVVVVHVYGMPAQMEAILAVAGRYGIPVLEDAAEALGSKINGEALGVRGAVGVYSFNNNKLLTTYGGGALVTRDEEIYRKVVRWAEQSREEMPYYDHREVGFTYRMGPLNAGIGLVQLQDFEARVRRRREIFDRYRALLSPAGRFLEEPSGSESNRWLTTVVWEDKAVLPGVMARLQQAKIEARYLWRPMHAQRVFQGFVTVTRGLAMYLFERGLSLPSGNDLTDKQVEEVCEVIGEVTDF